MVSGLYKIMMMLITNMEDGNMAQCPNFDIDDFICQDCLIQNLEEATTKYGYININCNYTSGFVYTPWETAQDCYNSQDGSPTNHGSFK